MTLQTVLVFATPVGFYLALGVINLLLGHKSQIDAWAEANPRLAAMLKLSRSLGLDPWMLLQSLSLFIRGRLPATMKASETKRTTIKPPPLAVLVLALGLAPLFLRCQTSVNWPAVARCVPTEQIGRDIVDQVWDILLRGDDYEQALADLAAKYGPDGPAMVVCVVDALINKSLSPQQADPENVEANKRGRAFLRHAGTKVER